MKHTFVLLATMAAAVVMSCNKLSPKGNTNENSLSYVYTINASIADVADVKSNYDADGKFSWSAGDAISVLFHKGDDNQFFTLTTTGTGASASFSGVIETGFEIGASDGTSENKKILAFFPASVNHVYTAGEAPKFFVPASADFTALGAHYSANIPMYAILAAEGTIAFENIACAYKFDIKDLDDSINKIRVEISNQKTYALSGLWPVSGVGSDAYINYDYASPGSANSCLAYTVNVDDNKASVYVSTRYWGKFQPIIKIYNAENEYLLKTLTAASAHQPEDKGKVKPITISAPGTGTAPFVPAITIDGDMSDWVGITALPSTQNSRIREWKFKSDEQNVYFYFKMRKNRVDSAKTMYIGFDTDNDSSTGDTYGNVPGCEGKVKSIPFINVGTATEPVCVDGVDAASEVHGSSSASGVIKVFAYDDGSDLSSDSSSIYIELSIPKTNLGLPAAGNSITVGCSYDWYITGTQSVTLE